MKARKLLEILGFPPRRVLYWQNMFAVWERDRTGGTDAAFFGYGNIDTGEYDTGHTDCGDGTSG